MLAILSGFYAVVGASNCELQRLSISKIFIITFSGTVISCISGVSIKPEIFMFLKFLIKLVRGLKICSPEMQLQKLAYWKEHERGET